MKQCNHCLEWKDEEEFNWRYKSLGVRHPTCRECAHKFNKNYFEGNAKEKHLKQVKERKIAAREVSQQYIWDYLSIHPCTQCGESDSVVLEFHHVEDKGKEISVMAAGGYLVETIQREIDRCIVLCANCHRKLTHTEKGWYRGRKKQ